MNPSQDISKKLTRRILKQLVDGCPHTDQWKNFLNCMFCLKKTSAVSL